MKNQSLFNQFRQYLIHVRRNRQNSVDVKLSYITNHLAGWCKGKSVLNAEKFTSSFSFYIESKRLSPNYTDNICDTVRQFFTWLRQEHKPDISLVWIEGIRPMNRDELVPTEVDYADLETVREIANAPATTLKHKRIRALIVFLFLSGARVSAAVTLPLSAINWEERSVKQWPSLGVKTKGGKAATTHLLNIPDLIDVCKQWADLVESGRGLLFFAPLTSSKPRIKASASVQNVGATAANARSHMREYLKKIGQTYRRPHIWRHSHAIWGLMNSKSPAERKAISQNLMHGSLAITDSVYSQLKAQDRQKLINQITPRDSPKSRTALLNQIQSLCTQMLIG